MNNWLVGHIASGDAFFSGAGMVLAAIACRIQSGRLGRRLVFILLVLGLILISLSSTPLPYWYYCLAAAATAGWLVSLRWWQKRQGLTAGIAALVWIGGIAAEIPYHCMPRLQPVSSRAITILGDSVTAGLEENEAETWPKLFSRTRHVQMQDLSHVGEIAASALKRVRKKSIESPVVIVEIGGNDVLGFTSAPQFAEDLDALLKYLASQNCQVVMLELPLPPFYHAYGQTQRTLARKYGVALVPKRVFLQVLAADNATLDSIHLSQAGHQLMADRIWEIVGPILPD